jgi:hypothetical protein
LGNSQVIGESVGGMILGIRIKSILENIHIVSFDVPGMV